MDLTVIINKLPRKQISVAAYEQGKEPLSGSDGAFLLVANGLAYRGHNVVCISPGTKLQDTYFQNISWPEKLDKNQKVLWCYKGDNETLIRLKESEIRPYLWLHNPIGYAPMYWLAQNYLSGVIVVSDTERCPYYHVPISNRLGRIYNPVNPFFLKLNVNNPNRYQSQKVVFTGHLSERKGAHRVLQMWPMVRRQLADAQLIMVGSAKLYGVNWQVGRFGVAAPEFEEAYIAPLITEFGSLKAAGVTFAGLLSASAIRTLFGQSAMGIVNFNWSGSLETFCMSAVEMLADRLPVLSFARGALPETIGSSGGAILLHSPSLSTAANQLVSLLQNPDRLMQLGNRGHDYVIKHYALEHILDQWEILLQAPPDRLDELSGRWAGPTGLQYQLARIAKVSGLGQPYQTAIEMAKRIRHWFQALSSSRGCFLQ